MPSPAASAKTTTSPSTPAASVALPEPSQRPPDERQQVHCILTGKGGTGKTFSAWCLVQYLRDKGIQTEAIDTDPVNGSLKGFAALHAKSVSILQSDSLSLNVKEIDRLSQAIFTTDSHYVIDNGAASFLPFGRYLADTEFAEFAETQNRDLVLHVIVAGGSSMAPTILGLDTILNGFPPSVKIVAWLNSYFGPLEVDGRKFETMPVYLENTKRFRGVVRLPDLAAFGFRPNMQEMLTRCLTFQEAVDSPDFMMLEKQRLIIIRRQIWRQLDGALQ